MSNNGGNPLDRIVDPQGKALITEPKLIVLKEAPGVKINPKIITELSKLLHCLVLVLPMDAELIMGHVAKDHIEAIHKSIHQALGIKDS